MNPALIGFYSVFRRECYRFLSIPRQTLLGPLLETYLYITIFGAALGSRIHSVGGSSYIAFIIPGLLLMAISLNSFSNNASSLAQQKMMQAIEDQLASPVSNLSLLAAYTLGGFLRGAIIAVLTLVTASFLTHLPIVHPFLLFLSLTFSGLFFASLGVFVGLRSVTFDQISFYQTFILQPLIFLGGIFYSSSLLPEPFKTLTHFDPIFYMINTVRFAMLGRADINAYYALTAIVAATLAIIGLNTYLFKKGYKLRG
jgi:ABC-2 type transport system permease protein